jgi:hypothetical protein
VLDAVNARVVFLSGFFFCSEVTQLLHSLLQRSLMCLCLCSFLRLTVFLDSDEHIAVFSIPLPLVSRWCRGVAMRFASLLLLDRSHTVVVVCCV